MIAGGVMSQLALWIQQPEMNHDQAIIQHIEDSLVYKDSLTILNESLNGHEKWRERACVNLLASEGPMSHAARQLLAGPLASRTSAGHIGKHQRLFAGTHYIDKLEALCHAICRQLYDCHYVEHRLLGGTQANQTVYTALLGPGDCILSVSPTHGGDSSAHTHSVLQTIGVNIIDIPFDEHRRIDFSALEKAMIRHQPTLLSVGFSISLYPPDYKRLFSLCRQYQIISHADCAHELGLIAGQAYPNPLQLGADMMTGSTGKTLSGPQGGLLMWNNPTFTSALLKHTFPYAVGGYQNNRIAALTLSLIELQQFGQAYMHQAISNAQTLARALNKHDINLFGQPPFTKTHQVVILVESNHRRYMRQLEACNIITSIVNIPNTHFNQEGLRLGLMECTRKGMGRIEMKILADLIIRALKNIENPRDIANEVAAFSANFQTQHYCHHHVSPLTSLLR